MALGTPFQPSSRARDEARAQSSISRRLGDQAFGELPSVSKLGELGQIYTRRREPEVANLFMSPSAPRNKTTLPYSYDLMADLALGEARTPEVGIQLHGCRLERFDYLPLPIFSAGDLCVECFLCSALHLTRRRRGLCRGVAQRLFRPLWITGMYFQIIQHSFWYHWKTFLCSWCVCLHESPRRRCLHLTHPAQERQAGHGWMGPNNFFWQPVGKIEEGQLQRNFSTV